MRGFDIDEYSSQEIVPEVEPKLDVETKSQNGLESFPCPYCENIFPNKIEMKVHVIRIS